MGTMYFAKLNINEKIYDVYQGKEKIEEFLQKIFMGLNQEAKVLDNENSNITYKFVYLDKKSDHMVINGRIVKVFEGVNSAYDETTDTVKDNTIRNKAEYVTFSFDVRNEIIGFVSKISFKKELFVEKFKELIEVSVPEVGGIVIFLLNDPGLLDDKMARIQKLQKISVDLIPPNSDKTSMSNLVQKLGLDIEEANAKKVSLEATASLKSPLNKESKMIEGFISVVKSGYGSLIALGRNTDNEKVSLNSKTDTLYSKPIPDDQRDVIPTVEEKTRASVSYYKNLRAQEVVLSERQEKYSKE